MTCVFKACTKSIARHRHMFLANGAGLGLFESCVQGTETDVSPAMVSSVPVFSG